MRPIAPRSRSRKSEESALPRWHVLRNVRCLSNGAKTLLNDSLYLAMKNGVPEEIVSTGTKLPYSSQLKTGFRLGAGADHIAVPIQRRDYGNVYKTIASGEVSFKKTY